MNSPKKYRLLLSEFIDSLDEQILDSSDNEIMENANESEISKFDEIAKKQIVAYRKNQRQIARREYLSNIQDATTNVLSLPNEMKRKLELLSTFFKNNHNVPTEFTMAFREGKDLSENDIDSLLQDLIELGLLNKKDLGTDK